MDWQSLSGADLIVDRKHVKMIAGLSLLSKYSYPTTPQCRQQQQLLRKTETLIYQLRHLSFLQVLTSHLFPNPQPRHPCPPIQLPLYDYCIIVQLTHFFTEIYR